MILGFLDTSVNRKGLNECLNVSSRLAALDGLFPFPGFCHGRVLFLVYKPPRSSSARIRSSAGRMLLQPLNKIACAADVIASRGITLEDIDNEAHATFFHYCGYVMPPAFPPGGAGRASQTALRPEGVAVGRIVRPKRRAGQLSPCETPVFSRKGAVAQRTAVQSIHSFNPFAPLRLCERRSIRIPHSGLHHLLFF